jgi:hypothetical protein
MSTVGTPAHLKTWHRIRALGIDEHVLRETFSNIFRCRDQFAYRAQAAEYLRRRCCPSSPSTSMAAGRRPRGRSRSVGLPLMRRMSCLSGTGYTRSARTTSTPLSARGWQNSTIVPTRSARNCRPLASRFGFHDRKLFPSATSPAPGGASATTRGACVPMWAASSRRTGMGPALRCYGCGPTRPRTRWPVTSS